MLKIGIIIGSTRPNRVGEGVARWVYETASKRAEAQFELIDLRDFELPLLDEPTPASGGPKVYTKEHTKRWSQKISSLDGFIFVSPEYNHGTSAALKNALDYLWYEWNNKVAGFVAYGGEGGTRAVENLRTVMCELEVACVRKQLALSLRRDFENYSIFTPDPHHESTLNSLIDQLLLWGGALQKVRLEK